MPHPYDLPPALRDVLIKSGVPRIGTKIILTCRAKIATSQNANGGYNFSGDYSRVILDITDRLSQSVRMRLEKQIAPTGEGKSSRGGNITVSFFNPDGYFASAQDGSIIDPNSIQNAYLDIFATFGGQELQVYRGRIIGAPKERRGETVFTIRDAISDILNVPLRWEGIDPEQNLTFSGGSANSTSHSFEDLAFYDAYAYFDSIGSVRPTLKSSGSVDLLSIDFFTNATYPRSLYPGRYEIEFLDNAGNFVFRSPGAGNASGNILTNFISPEGITIARGDWVVPQGAEIEGDTIEFWVFATLYGNPVRIIKYLLERAFLQNWGQALAQPAYLPINWARLAELESAFSYTNVFFSETNKENTSLEFGSGDKPFSIKQAVELLAEHIGGFLIVDEQGRLSVATSELDFAEVPQQVTGDMLTDHEFLGGEAKTDLVGVTYGFDPVADNFAAEQIFLGSNVQDLDPAETYNAGDIVLYFGAYYQALGPISPGAFDPAAWAIHNAQEYRFSFRYFKSNVSDSYVQAFGNTIASRLFLSDRKLSLKFLPQLGLPIGIGDKFTLNLTEKPAIKDSLVEVYEVSKLIGGEVVCKVVEIGRGVTANFSTYCNGTYCSGNYCA